LDGFLIASPANFKFDKEELYNHIRGMGMMIYGPIQGTMKDFHEAENSQQEVFMSLHEISHSLLEGVNPLVAKGAISEKTKQMLQAQAMCLNAATPDSISSDIIALFAKAYQQHNMHDAKAVGMTIAVIANNLCEKQHKFLF